MKTSKISNIKFTPFNLGIIPMLLAGAIMFSTIRLVCRDNS